MVRSLSLYGAGAFLSVGVLRFLTLAPDPWEWDEVLFTEAVRKGIDLRVHRPHPPGYPLFIETARALHVLGVKPYRSLALVGAAGSLLAVVALFALLKIVGLKEKFALFGSILYALVPSIWLFGVRGFSDGPAAAAFFGASALFLRSLFRKSDLSLVAGFALSAVAAGIRPQAGIPLFPLGLVAGAMAFLRGGSSRRAVLLALTAAIAISGAIWIPAIQNSGGWTPFIGQIRVQASDVTRNALSVAQVATWPVLGRWLADPFGSRVLFGAVAVLGAVGLAVGRKRAGLLTLLFVPAIAFVPYSAPIGAPRYGAILLGLPCGLAALGFEWLERRWAPLVPVAGTALLAVSAAVALGPVVLVATRPSPPVAAMAALREWPFQDGAVLHDPVLRQHVEAFLPGRSHGGIPADRPVWAAPGDVVVTADRSLPDLPAGAVFYFEDRTLKRISAGRMLRVTISRATAVTSIGIHAAGGSQTRVLYDAWIPVGIDTPRDRAVIRGPLVVRGWCQERGGGIVEPVDFRVDGVSVAPLHLERYARPDVSETIPEIGDASHAGFMAELPSTGLARGEHLLVVTVRTRDGRERVADGIHFFWDPGAGHR